MDDHHGGGFLFDFGKDEKTVDDTITMFNLDPLMVARGLFEFFLSPILAGRRNSEQQDSLRVVKRFFMRFFVELS